jgi:hypothetical protein
MAKYNLLGNPVGNVASFSVSCSHFSLGCATHPDLGMPNVPFSPPRERLSLLMGMIILGKANLTMSCILRFLEDVITDTAPQNTGAVPVQVFISLAKQSTWLMGRRGNGITQNGPLSEIRLARLM